MYFKLWSFWHIVFIISPFVIAFGLYYLCKNKSQKVKDYLGVALGALCVIILVVRNISIISDSGFHTEIIPLQICHMANFVILYAFLTKNKSALTLVWCFYFIFGFLSIIFADSLTNYTSRNVRFYAYIFGHLLIAVSGLWILLNKMVVISKKTLTNTFSFILINFGISLIANNILNNYLDVKGTANYFYLMKPEKGTPLELLYFTNLNWHIGRFSFNLVYILGSFLFGVFIVSLMSYIAKKVEVCYNENI